VIRVIGGGISGLFAAYAFKKAGHDVELFEKSSRLGGIIESLRLPWGLVETAANGMMNSARIEELSQDIGVEFKGMQKTFRRRYIYRERPRQLPLSNLEALRFSVGMLRKQEPQASETLWDYSQRTFGFGATKYLIEPAAMGVFGVDSMALSALRLFFKKQATAPSW
jgi:protoporphyrinogen/coproporphyrinogen III oxidase